MVTNGGSPNSAYQIARLLQRNARPTGRGDLILFIPAFCKSAGTLIALGANRIVMHPVSELGPLDVQLLKQDEIGSRKSGLLARSTFESLAAECFDLFETMMINIKRRSGDLISFKTASDIASSVATGALAPVFAQINPETVGSDYRDLQVAREYGLRLARIGGNVKNGAVDQLVSGYPSHEFIIDKKEAEEEIFRQVEEPTDSMYELLRAVDGPVYREPAFPIVARLDIEVDDEDDRAADIDRPGEATGDVAPELDASQCGDRSGDSQAGRGEPAQGASDDPSAPGSANQADE